MSAWGGTNAKSCDSLLRRLEQNDPNLQQVHILPNKVFGDAELHRLALLLQQRYTNMMMMCTSSNGNGSSSSIYQQPSMDSKQQHNNDEVLVEDGTSEAHYPAYSWQSLLASGHAVSASALETFGRSVAMYNNAAVVVAAANVHNNNNTALLLMMQQLAIGDVSMRDDGVIALLRGLQQAQPQQQQQPAVSSNRNDIHNNDPTTTNNKVDDVPQQPTTTEPVPDTPSLAFTSASIPTPTTTGQPTTICCCCYLVSLDLSYKSMTLTGFIAVAQFTIHCPSLTTLNLSRNPLLFINVLSSSSSAASTPKGDDDNNISSNTSTCEATDDFSNMMYRGAFRSVQHLDLTDCGVNTTICTTILASILLPPTNKDNTLVVLEPNVPPTMALQTLYLNQNPLTDCGLQSLQLSQSCPNLQELHLSHCQLTDATYCCSALHAAVLDVSGNDFTHVVPPPPQATVSATSSSWQVMNLSGNTGLGNDGVQTILDMLFQIPPPPPPTLVVNVESSSSSSFDARMGVPCHSTNNSDKWMLLDLSETNCGTKAAAAVYASIVYGVQTLRLYNNQLGAILQQSSTTTTNPTDENGFHSIAKALRDAFMWVREHRHCNNDDDDERERNHRPVIRHTLDVAGNNADEASVVALLQVVLDVIVNYKNDFVQLDCLVIGGNANGQAVEDMVRQIQQLQPTLDIARDKLKRQAGPTI